MDTSYETRDGYLYVKMVGEFAPSAAQDNLLKCIEQTRSHGLNRILFDATLVTNINNNQISTMTRYDASVLIINLLPRNFRMAILETPQQLKGGHFSENVMVNRGVLVKITSNLNEALDYLGVTSVDKPAGAGSK